MAGNSIATAWVQLAFSADGVKQQIEKELGGADAGALGEKTGHSFVGGLGGVLGTIGKVAAVGLAALGAAAAGAAIKGVTAFTDFQRSMNEVFTLIPSAGQDTFDQLTKQTKDFSKEFGVLPDKVVPALYQSLSAGVPPGNVFDFLTVAQKAAKGGVTELETAVDGITSTVNAYGSSTISAAQASDLMFTAVKLGKTTFGELSKSLFNVNPIASALGVKFSDVTAALAAMTAQGIPTSVATTQLRAAFTELSKEGTVTSDTFKEISGKSFKDFVAAGGDTQGALKLLEQHAKDTGVGINDLFSSSEAGSAALALTGKGADAFSNALTGMQTSAGATEGAFNQMNQGLGPIFDKLKAGAQVFLIDLGQKLAPAVEAGLGKVGEIFAKLKEVAIPVFGFIEGGVKALIAAFKAGDGDVTSGGFAGAMEKIGNAARTAFDFIKSIDFGSIFSTALAFIKPLASAWADFFGAQFNLAKAALTTVLDLIKNNKETLIGLGAALLTAGTIVKNVLAKGFEIASGVLNFLATNMELVKAIMVPLIAGFVAFKAIALGIQVYNGIVSGITAVTKIWSAVQFAFNAIMSANPISLVVIAIAALVAGVIYAYTHFESFRNVIDKFGDAIQFVFNWVKDHWQLILALLIGPVGVAVLALVKNWDTIKDGVRAMVDGVIDFINGFIDVFVRLPLRILNAIGNFSQLLVSKGWELIQGFINGYLNAVGTVWSFFQNLGSTVAGYVGGMINWLWQKGVDLIQGFINGYIFLITNGFGAIRNLGSTILSAVGDLGSILYNVGRNVISGFINGIKDSFGGVAGVLGDLTGKLTSWKGPEARDKKLLVPAGGWIIEGLIEGLEAQFPAVQASLGTLTSQIAGTSFGASGASLSPIAGLGISQSLVAPSGGIVLNQVNNTNADPGEIAAATAFKLITSGV